MNKTYTLIALCLASAAPLTSGQLTEAFRLTASDRAEYDEFGFSVGVFGTTAIVGAPRDDDAGVDSGAAYAFELASGKQFVKLTADDAAAHDQFASAVAISGTTATIGAPLDDDGGSLSGSAYVFDVITGQQRFKLTANDAAAADLFGSSVASYGTRAIIGAAGDDDGGSFSGSAYIFDTSTGRQLIKLTADDAAERDQFGRSVAISNATAIIGAPDDRIGGSKTGSAYLFDTTSGQQLFKLTAADAADGDKFGSSVAICGTKAIVGASGDDGEFPDSGSAYVFDTTTGQQVFKLTASDAAEADFFGGSVSISGHLGVVGTTKAYNRARPVYLFDLATGQHVVTLITAPGAPSSDSRNFGQSIAMDRRAVIVGAPSAGFRPSGAGAAYIFDVTLPCPGDIADAAGTLGALDSLVSFGDFMALLGLVGPCPGGTPGCTGDFADDFGTLNGGDGMVSFGDFLALLGLVGPCP